jgi:hypothetical protein
MSTTNLCMPYQIWIRRKDGAVFVMAEYAAANLSCRALWKWQAAIKAGFPLPEILVNASAEMREILDDDDRQYVHISGEILTDEFMYHGELSAEMLYICGRKDIE